MKWTLVDIFNNNVPLIFNESLRVEDVKRLRKWHYTILEPNGANI